jgi:hypothetical protein
MYRGSDMEISKISSIEKQNFTTKSNRNVSFSNYSNNAEEMFDEYAPKKLPDNKAIKLVKRPSIVSLLLNIITIPLGFFGISIHDEYKLVDIDPNNLSPKEQKMIRQGKLINFVPRGYHIENNKVKKNK